MPLKKKAAKKTAKKSTKSFEETLWDTANTALRESGKLESEGTPQSMPKGQDNLRGSVESSEYSRAERDRLPQAAQRADAEASVNHVVLSLIFLKFVSDKFEERRAELVAKGKEDYLDMVEFYTTQIPVCLWFLTKNKKADSERDYRNREGETLFIDTRKIGSMISRTQKELDVGGNKKIHPYAQAA